MLAIGILSCVHIAGDITMYLTLFLNTLDVRTVLVCRSLLVISKKRKHGLFQGITAICVMLNLRL